ncbi:hypothetical protein JOF46_003594 [Paeniglutamicibacter psychrophenolicus]|uniref:Uncharacterized protein n=1 Tax=Paeniglutamicibacter psychrophenolicus TaxID=257454 RepID=A0ABS4WHK3_9MICC|nr:hypothetical protein [Paeniglutamicibacter psychrophenolicus]
MRSLRTTGASMVEDAERTNSPISCSFATASFEVIPSSLASSCTRTLATFLLSEGPHHFFLQSFWHEPTFAV